MDKKNSLIIKMAECAENLNLKNLKTSYDEKRGVAIVSGYNDGIQYTTTLKLENNGYIQTNSKFSTDMNKEELILQVKSLCKQGYKQTEVATMLGISQSLVSRYKNL